MKRILLIVLVSILTFSCTSSNYSITPVSQDEFKTLFANDSMLQIVDVRTLEEYNSGFIKGAVLLDVKQDGFLQKAINRLDNSKPVYLYCKSGSRSQKAASELIRSKKFKTIYYLKGGFTEWKQNLN